MTDPQTAGRSRPPSPEAALAAEAERILEALEQGKRATIRPMPQLQRAESNGSGPRQQ